MNPFFQEAGRPVTADRRISPPSPDEIQRFLETARRYGYWLANPEENAAVGISLFLQPYSLSFMNIVFYAGQVGLPITMNEE